MNPEITEFLSEEQTLAYVEHLNRIKKKLNSQKEKNICTKYDLQIIDKSKNNGLIFELNTEMLLEVLELDKLIEFLK
jgi:hypothetical protein